MASLPYGIFCNKPQLCVNFIFTFSFQGQGTRCKNSLAFIPTGGLVRGIKLYLKRGVAKQIFEIFMDEELTAKDGLQMNQSWWNMGTYVYIKNFSIYS